MKNRDTILTGILLAFAWLALLPLAQAVIPAPDGGYLGGNTAEGQNALLSLNVNAGSHNTAVGWFSLKSNVEGGFNTAVGSGTLFRNTGDANTAIGGAALFSNTSASHNTAVGFLALFHNIDGGSNTAIGDSALFSNTNGEFNTATGYQALYANTFGIENTANGFRALYNNTTGNDNTANGVSALYNNTIGGGNTANGRDALYHNITGSGNTANGILALFSNTEGNANAANGSQALAFNTIGGGNTADGYQALYSNTTGGNNTATGLEALYSNTTGEGNTANGRTALRSNTTGGFNTAIGRSALADNTGGESNIALGYLSGGNLTTGDNNIDIGNLGFPGESGTIRIGSDGTQTRTFIAGISGATASGGVTVFVNASGQLGTLTSSRRFKDQIKPMDKASEALFALNPVSFRYKKEIDPEGVPQFGLVAEEVHKVNPDLVILDEQGKPFTVRYEQINAMLLNEFLKEHRKVEAQNRRLQEQGMTIAELKSSIAQQEKATKAVIAQLKEQATRIQKVSAQIQISKFATGRIRRGGPAPQVVLNNP